MIETALAADEAQEFRHSSRKMAALAEINWESLMTTSIPMDVCQEMLLAWWKQMLTPEIKLPDFGSIFKTGDEDE